MILDEALLMVATITHVNTFWPRFNRKVTTVDDWILEFVWIVGIFDLSNEVLNINFDQGGAKV